MKKRLVCFTLCILAVTGCVAPTPPGPTSTPAPPTVTPLPTATLTPAPPREVVVVLPESPDGLNPFYARSWAARAVADLFLNGLWRLDGALVPHPELAARVPSRANGGISEDGRVLTIALRTDVLWSDGVPVTAEDVVFTYQMAVAPGNAVASRFPYNLMESVAALDAHTVEVRFVEPFAPWASALFPFVLPRHVLQPVFEHEGTLDRAVWNRMPGVGSGPFVFAGEEDGALLFEANPLYWRGRAAAERVRLTAEPDPAARLAAVTSGTADLAPLLWPETSGWVGALPDVRFLPAASGVVETLAFNLTPGEGHPALQQAVVRRAIALALERDLVCDVLAPGQARPAFTLWSGTMFEDSLRSVAAPDNGPESLLREAGWEDGDGDGVREKDGLPLVLRYAVPASPVDRTAVQVAVAGMLRQVGVGIEPVVWREGAGWDLAQWAESPAGYPDPDDPRWLCIEARPGGMNRTGVCDEALDDALYAQVGSVDLEARAALLYQLETLNAEQAWWVPLCSVPDVWAASSRVESAAPWRGAPFWDAWGW
ncbi:MAG: peptide ABC transporter substrate-binding protein [Anaerolineae bacterium]|nr:peptide ABC transporter substrate-binding protein [Anaerolineae bacterium]